MLSSARNGIFFAALLLLAAFVAARAEDIHDRRWENVSLYYRSRQEATGLDKEMHRKYDKAVVMILVTNTHGEQFAGSGFFISPDGELITNFHVMRAYAEDPGAQVTFELESGKKLRNFTVGRCKAESLDLCHLKLPLYPEKYFSTCDPAPSEGDPVFVLGNPAGHGFHLGRGNFLGAVHIGLASEVEVSIPFIGGVSGGPIFTRSGALVGAAYLNSQMKLDLVPKHLQNQPVRSLGIAAYEIHRYQAATEKFVSPQEYFGR